MLHYMYNGQRHVEVEPTHAELEISVKVIPTGAHIRTPGEPLPRDFTASVTILENIAHVSLGAGHTKKANPHEIKNAVREALINTLGVEDIQFRRGTKA